MAISENNEIRSNLLQCPLDNNDILFFTLMDYLNNLFTSKDPKDILRFYDYFENRDQLIKWMMERPRGNYRIVEFNKGENDIIVVIPTMDVNGKFAKTSRNEIFKGLHIIFVESGVGNYYFNYAHNCNAGIKKAIEYTPKWIILSNDDMYKIDDVDVLKKELLKINHKDYDVIFTQPSKYHSNQERVVKFNIIYIIYFLINSNRRKIYDLFKKYKVKYLMCNKENSRYCYKLFKKGYDFIEIQDFGIFSGEYLKKINGNLFDDNFINEGEDTDLSLKFSLNPDRIDRINYKIGDYIGSSLGTGIDRSFRSIAGVTYLNFKWYEIIDKLMLKNKNIK